MMGWVRNAQKRLSHLGYLLPFLVSSSTASALCMALATHLSAKTISALHPVR